MDIMATAATSVRPYASHQCNGVYHKPGGGARNTAENLVRLGCDTRLISTFGDDLPGRGLMDSVGLTGINISASLLVPNHATAAVVIVNDHKGEHFCMIGDDSISTALTPEWLQTKQALLQDASLIVTNTHMSEAALEWLFTHHSSQPIFIDTANIHRVERIRPWLRQVHTIKCNRGEAHLLSGLPFGTREHAPAVAAWFNQQGISQVILSLGEYGLYYSNGEQAGWMMPIPVEVVDVTGAGDALMAGLAYGWLNALSFTDTVRFALGCAALTLTTPENNHPELSPAAVLGIL